MIFNILLGVDAWWLAKQCNKADKKVKDLEKELEKEKKLNQEDPHIKTFQVAEERKVQKIGAMVALSPSVFANQWPREEIEKVIREEMIRQITPLIEPYIEIGMQEFPFDSEFKFYGQLRVVAKNPSPIDFTRAYKLTGNEWRIKAEARNEDIGNHPI